MRKTQSALSDISSKKIQVTIYSAIVCCASLVFAPAVFAQNTNEDASQVGDNFDEASDQQSDSEDPVRAALKAVFKETAPERIKETASSKKSDSDSPRQALVESEPSTDQATTKQSESTGVTSHKVAFSGVADYYADRFHGRKTASGQIHDKTKMTAAHLSLPFGTKVKVVSRHTGKSCVVTVNDRGPYTKNRIIDLSLAAAKELGLVTATSRLVDCYLIDSE